MAKFIFTLAAKMFSLLSVWIISVSDVFLLLQLTVIHPKYGLEASPGSGRLVSHQQMSRFAADLPTAHFISQSKGYAAAPGMEQGKEKSKVTK